MSANDSTSSTLLRRAIARQEDAWDRLVLLYAPLVRHWCRQSNVPASETPDVEQEVFAAVSSGLAGFRNSGATFRGWLRGIARHKVGDYFRLRGELAAGGTDAQRWMLELPDRAADPELSEGPAEIGAVYQRALALVRDQFENGTWDAFWRVAVEGRPTAEVAAEMGTSANAVRQAKSRVLRRLKEEVGDLIT